MQFLSKYPWNFFTKLEKNPKIQMKPQKTLTCQNKLGKKKAGDSILPDFRLYYKATIIKRARYWYKNRSIDQWNRTGSPEINPHTYGQLIYLWQKKARMYDGENTISSTSGVRKWTAVCKTMTLEHFFTLYTKINSK